LPEKKILNGNNTADPNWESYTADLHSSIESLRISGHMRRREGSAGRGRDELRGLPVFDMSRPAKE